MGWYVQNGKLVFSNNFFTECTRIEATEPLAPGQQTVRAEFVYDGGGMGKGAAVSLFAGEKRPGRDVSSAP